MFMVEDNTTAEITDEMLDDFFAQALVRHQAEDWSAAESFYQKILAVIPDQANVNYNFGMLKLQLQQSNASLNYFKKALAADETEPKYWISYVEALVQAGQKNVAIDVLMRGIEQGLHGDEVNALVNQLTKPAAVQVTIANYNHQPVIIPSVANQIPSTAKPTATHTASIKVENGTKKKSTKKDIQAYLKHPEVNKVLALQQSGKLSQAKKQGENLLKLLPTHPILLTCLAGIALAERRFDEAASLFEQSLKIVPEQTTALSYLSITYLEQRKFKDAMRCVDEAIAINPKYADAYNNKGNVFRAQKQYQEARQCYEQSLALSPNSVDTKYNLGLVYFNLKDYHQAANYFKQVVSLESNDAHSLHLYADALINIENHDEAFKFFNASVALNKEQIESREGRGLASLKIGQFELARDDFMYVIKKQPKNGSAYNNLGVTLRELGQYEEALDAYNTVLDLGSANNQRALTNKGMLLVDMHRYDEAMDCYKQALHIAPDFSENKWNKALLHLLMGDFVQGWPLYEARWQSILKMYYRKFDKPLWLGNESLVGKTILIYPEQGLGDYIQFCRYVAEVEKLGATVLLEVLPPLLPLMQTLNVKAILIESGSSLPEFDYHCPIMSLPLAFSTQQETIPANTPYLSADVVKVAYWKERLGNKTKPRVGLVWSGSVTHKHDCYRSITLETLGPIFSLPYEFHALQKEVREHDIKTLNTLNVVQTHQDSIHDFADTAALIEQMDIVIAVDTSVAHLAGAMGKECWVLLPYSPDFRWQLDRTDSPWYPTITLFRQSQFNDWSDVIASLKMKLETLSAEGVNY